MSDKQKFHLLSISEPLDADEFDAFRHALDAALTDTDIDGQIAFINSEAETISKDELRELIDE
jgi:hypothetical protein